MEQAEVAPARNGSRKSHSRKEEEKQDRAGHTCDPTELDLPREGSTPQPSATDQCYIFAFNYQVNPLGIDRAGARAGSRVEILFLPP